MEPRGGVLRVVARGAVDHSAGQHKGAAGSTWSVRWPLSKTATALGLTALGVGTALAYKYTRWPVHPRRARVISVVVRHTNELEATRLEADGSGQTTKENLFYLIATKEHDANSQQGKWAIREMRGLKTSLVFTSKFRIWHTGGHGDFDVSISPYLVGKPQDSAAKYPADVARGIYGWFDEFTRRARREEKARQTSAYLLGNRNTSAVVGWRAEASQARRWHVKVCLETPDRHILPSVLRPSAFVCTGGTVVV